MRELIIDTIGEIGGHFGANLGTCELAVALHSLLDSPRDKILWDVGHQAYPHKVLTGRRDRLDTIRQYEGLAPFCSVFESEHDIMGAGHASTSIGYAVGLKEAMRKGIGEDGKVVAVIGDGALTGGVAYEALHNAGGLQTPMVIVLNDNGMSISPNVGAISRYFQRVRLNPRLYHAREDVEERLTKLPLGLGRRIERLGPEIKAAIKAYAAPGLFFEELDLAYMGVIDGHDVTALRRPCARRSTRSARSSSTSTPSRARASSPPRRAASRGWRSGTRPSPARSSTGNGGPEEAVVPVERVGLPGEDREAREAAAQAAAAVHRGLRRRAGRGGQARPRVIGITAAMAGGTGLNKLAKALPEQYYDVGIAEQDAVLFASGLAIQGAKPVCAIYSTFLQRAFDQLVHDVCLQKLNVVFAMDRAGLVGDDGPTHHGSFDVSYFRPLPNVVRDGAPRRGDARPHAAHRARLRRRPDRLPLPARRRRGRADARQRRRRSRSARASSCCRASASRCSATATASRSALRAAEILARARPRADRRRRAASPSRSTASWSTKLAADHDLLVTIEENVLPGGFGSAVLEHARGRVRRRLGARAGAARRASRPLRHPRQAGPPARGGRLHRRGRRRARPDRAAYGIFVDPGVT